MNVIINKQTMTKYKSIVLKLTLAAVTATAAVLPAIVSAQSSSPNYKVEEVFFGTGGELDVSSPAYRAQQSGGAQGGGSAASTAYDANGGATTGSEPFLEAGVISTTVDLGTLTASSTSFGAAQSGDCNCSFYVRSYLSSEYAVVSVSSPPTSESGSTLNAKTTRGVPSASTSVEEFGINLVDNGSPDVGQNPANLPDNSFADGEAATDYDVVNEFKYSPGDVLARSQASPGNPAIGRTNYTISYIAKVNNTSPAGVYKMNHNLVIVTTF